MMHAWNVLTAIALAIVATPLVVRLARRFKVVDKPGLRKVHTQPIPRIGGLAIAVAVVGDFAFCVIPNSASSLSEHWPALAALASGALLMFAIGLVDDVFTLSAKIKLLGQLLAASIVAGCGIRVNVFCEFGPALAWLDWPATVFWIVIITNAINLIDGLDALAAGISAIAASVMVVFALHYNLVLLAAVNIALLGALAGFLLFNMHPARIFLGDSGTYFIGFLLAGGSCMGATQTRSPLPLGLLALALGVPILDVLFSILRRMLQRRSVFASDMNHIHHRLLRLGLAHPRVVLVLHGASCLAALAAVVVLKTTGIYPLLAPLLAAAALLAIFRVAGAIRLKESLEALTTNLRISRQNKLDRRRFEEAQLRMMQAKGFYGWWRTLCMLAGNLGVKQVSLLVLSSRGDERLLTWHNPVPCRAGTMRVILPRSEAAWLELQAEVSLDPCLEIAGQRVALFNRLLEDFSLHMIFWQNLRAQRSPKPPRAVARRLALKESA